MNEQDLEVIADSQCISTCSTVDSHILPLSLSTQEPVEAITDQKKMDEQALEVIADSQCISTCSTEDSHILPLSLSTQEPVEADQKKMDEQALEVIADSQCISTCCTEDTHTSSSLSLSTQEPVEAITSSQSIQLLTTSLGMSMIAQLSSSEDTSSDSSDDSIIVVSDTEKDVQAGVEVCPKVKGEIDYRDLPTDDECIISFPPDGKLLPIGEVSHYTEKLLLIKSFTNTPAVNEGTILWREDKTSIAPIFETFGPVKAPFYSILVNSKENGSKLGLKTGDTVYVVPGDLNLTMYVFTSKLLEQKGCDASWKNDLEMPQEFQQFSDDEQESLKKKKKSKKPGPKPSYTQESLSQPSTGLPRQFNRPVPFSRPAPPMMSPQFGAYHHPHPNFMRPPQPLMFPPPGHVIPSPPPPYPPPFGHPYPSLHPHYHHPWHQFPPPPPH